MNTGIDTLVTAQVTTAITAAAGRTGGPAAHAARAADEVAATTVGMLGDAIAVQTRLHVNTGKPNPRRLT